VTNVLYDQHSPGELIRHFRLRIRLTQHDLALRSGLSERTLRDVEQGRVAPRQRSLLRICDGLALSGADRDFLLAVASAAPHTATAQLALAILGPIAAHRRGQPVALGPPLRRALLGLLALHGGDVVSRAEIVDILWGEEPPKSHRTVIQREIGRLRRLLSPGEPSTGLQFEAIDAVDGGFRLNTGEYKSDLMTFDSLLTQARAARARGAGAAALRYYEHALRCWRGPVMSDVDQLAQHPLTVAIQQQRVDGVVSAADMAMELHRFDKAQAWLRSLAEQEPTNETLQAQFMLALAAGGHRAEALNVFGKVRTILAGNLGIEPGPELTAAHTRVLRHTVPTSPAELPPGVLAVDAAPVFVGVQANPARPLPAQLPAIVAGFTGRTRELHQMQDALARSVLTDPPSVPMIAISGTAGVGKTSLAVQFAQRVADRFPGGQMYLNLRGFDPTNTPVDQAEALRTLLDGLGVPADGEPADARAQINLFRSLVARQRLILLLDNARDATQVRALLPGSPHCLVLITSRTDLAGLAATTGAVHLTLDPPDLAEAWDVFAARVGSERAHKESHAAYGIVKRCACLPLAIAVAGAQAASRPGVPLDILARALTPARGVLDALAQDDPVADVRTAFASSYRLLSRPAARIFRLLGTRSENRFDDDLIADLTGVAPPERREAIMELVRSSMMTETSPGQWRLHGLLHTYAWELNQIQA
jgi:DNA-binding SARP family transcriptional activator/DNA-binding XRE family transcriptional regulator